MQPGRLNEHEAKQLLLQAGIPCPREALLTEDDAIPEEIRYPAYVKICSRDIIHKSDADLVTRVHSPREAAQAAQNMRHRARRAFPEVTVQGILISEDAATRQSRELIVGTTEDPDFGSVISLGMGGLSTEVYADVAFRAVPLHASDVYDMLHELRGRAMLGPFRGRQPINVGALTDAVMAFSTLLEQHPEIVEGDINPLLVDHERAVAVDASLEVRP